MTPSTNLGATLRTESGGGTNITKSTSFNVVVKKAYTIKEIGGRIFYIHNDNSLTYHFFDSSGNEINNQTVSGLANAYYYAIDGDQIASTDKFYVYCTNNGTPDGNIVISDDDNLSYGRKGTLYGTSTDNIGSGKSNSAIMLTALGTSSSSIWYWIKTSFNDINKNGHNDWYIGSKAEHDKLRTSGLPGTSAYNKMLWTSTEADRDSAYLWYNSTSLPYDQWYKNVTNVKVYVIAFRSF